MVVLTSPLLWDGHILLAETAVSLPPELERKLILAGNAAPWVEAVPEEVLYQEPSGGNSFEPTEFHHYETQTEEMEEDGAERQPEATDDEYQNIPELTLGRGREPENGPA